MSPEDRILPLEGVENFRDYGGYAVPGGQNRLRSDNSGVDFGGLNRMGDDPQTPKVVEGLAFDEGFEADFWVGLTCGGPNFAVYMNYAELLTGGGGPGGYLGSGGAGLAGAQIFKSGLGFGLDNSNTAGVDGGGGLASGAGATTGVELRIPLTAIPGYTSGDLKVCVFVNGGGHDFVSNQILAPLGGGSNLGLRFGPQAAIGDVVGYGVVEQHHLLTDVGNRLAQGG